MPDDFATRSEVASLRRRVRALESVVAQFCRRRQNPDRDGGALGVLLPAIRAAIGDGVFAAVDLAALAALPGRDALAVALAPLCNAGGLRSLGRLLARGAGRDLGGLRLLRVGDSRDGALWQVTETRETRAPDCKHCCAPAR